MKALKSIIIYTVFSILPSAVYAQTLLFETIDQGQSSSYFLGNTKFKGIDMLISNQNAWEIFWAKHVAGKEPQPQRPLIDFSKEVVIASILGNQANIKQGVEVLLVSDTPKWLSVLVHERILPDERIQQVNSDTINPFHIIKVKLPETSTSVSFEHQQYVGHQAGLWGGPGISMVITDDRTVIEFDCAHAIVKPSLQPDLQGNFSEIGTIVLERGPISIGQQQGIARPAMFSGTIVNDHMSLKVIFTDSENNEYGTFSLTRYKSGQITKCL